MAKKSQTGTPFKEKAKEVGALFFILASLFFFISLATYHPGDISSITSPPNDPVHNKGGQVGAAIAYVLYHNFGIAAYALVILAAYWAGMIFFRKTINALYWKLTAAVFAVFSIATLASIQSLFGFGLQETAPSAGGVYGRAFEMMLKSAFGTTGALLIVLLTMSTSLVLATNWHAYVGAQKLAGWTWRGSVWLYGFLSEKFKQWKQRHSMSVDEKRRTELDRMIQQEQKRLQLEEMHEKIQMAGTEPAPAPLAPVVAEPEAFVTEAEESKPATPPTPKVQRKKSDYQFPTVDLFEDKQERLHTLNEKDIKERMLVIEKTLADFDISARVVNYESGPTVTIYELELAAGTRYAKLVALADDLAISLKAPNVRVVAPLPGKSSVGVEVPNPFPDVVRMREFFKNGFEEIQKIPLPMMLGKTNGGQALIKSMTEMPHLLIAGTTGSGKSVCLNAIITGFLTTMSPDDMKLLLIDPKMVELSAFKDVPHLWSPVITDMKKAPMILDWLVKEMEDRYIFFSKAQVKKIENYNQLGEAKIRERLAEDGELPQGVPIHMPYIVVVIDELADMMMTSAKEVESTITRLAQKSRAVGIHLIVATQRPSVDVITGLIKSNMPARIAFKVAAKVDSRTILDQNGAERLMGKGDMLIQLPGSFSLVRSQCTFVSDKEIRDIVQYLTQQAAPEYHQELVQLDENVDFDGTDKDDLFEEAVRVVVENQRGSVSLLQRALGIGYSRAARMVDNMAKMGIVGDYKGSNARDVLVTPEQWEARKAPAPR